MGIFAVPAKVGVWESIGEEHSDQQSVTSEQSRHMAGLFDSRYPKFSTKVLLKSLTYCQFSTIIDLLVV